MYLVVGRRPQYTTQSRGRCECSQPYTSSTIASRRLHTGSAGRSMSLLQETRLALGVEVVDVGLSDHSLLQWSASSARPTPVVEETFTGINGFQSALLSALCLPNGWHGLEPRMMASLYGTKLNAILNRLDCAIPARTVTRRPLAGIPTSKNRRKINQ